MVFVWSSQDAKGEGEQTTLAAYAIDEILGAEEAEAARWMDNCVRGISWDFPLANNSKSTLPIHSLIDLARIALSPNAARFAFSLFKSLLNVSLGWDLPSYEHRVEYDTERPHVSGLSRVGCVGSKDLWWHVSWTAAFVLQRILGWIVQHDRVFQWLEFDLSSAKEKKSKMEIQLSFIKVRFVDGGQRIVKRKLKAILHMAERLTLCPSTAERFRLAINLN